MNVLCGLILELYRAAKETPVDEFQELALALVKAQTPFRTAFWGTGEMTKDGLVTHSAHLHNEPSEMLTDWVSINCHDPVIDDLVANPGRVQIYHPPTRHAAPKHAIVLDYTKRYGHLNCMSVTTMSKTHPLGQWLSLYRADQHNHFAQADGRILEQIMPHLIEALEINRMLGQVPLIHTDSGMTGTRAIARADGSLYHCGKKFTELLLEVWPEWKGGCLPAELMSALHSTRETILADHAIAISTSALGNMLLLKIRRISPLHILSQRELEVAKLYGQGKSYKEIGLLLNISPATVRNFLARIYTKLDIGKKVELVSLLSIN